MPWIRTVPPGEAEGPLKEIEVTLEGECVRTGIAAPETPRRPRGIRTDVVSVWDVSTERC
jgi:hypothetical protein